MYTDPSEINLKDPSSLFKYKPINKYTLINLINDEIYMPASKELNDPFECLANLDITNVQNSGFDIKAIDSFVKDVPEWIGLAGIYSMSSTPFDVLMWSHYAEYHKGICLEYARNSNNELGSFHPET